MIRYLREHKRCPKGNVGIIGGEIAPAIERSRRHATEFADLRPLRVYASLNELHYRTGAVANARR